MSKELMSARYGTVGSADYFRNLNQEHWTGNHMDSGRETAYLDCLRKSADNIRRTVDEIYEDLKKQIGVIRYLPQEHRKNMSKVLQGLRDICKMTSSGDGHCDNCISILSLSDSGTRPKSGASDREITDAVKLVRDSSFMNRSDRVDTIRKAMDWGENSTSGNLERTLFLRTLMNGKSREFLGDVWLRLLYADDERQLIGRCGKVICSEEYIDHIEQHIFGRDLPNGCGGRNGDRAYGEMVSKSLKSIGDRIERDLEQGVGDNDYIKDENAQRLKDACKDLERCGVRCYALKDKIAGLAWFVGGDPDKIRKLQQKLNELGVGEHLTEDGVYGKKTATNSSRFLNHFLEGVVPSLNWVNPLQTEFTGISIGSSKGQWNNVLQGENGFQYFRVDPPHATKSGSWKSGYFRGERRPIDYNHVNVNFSNPMSELETKLKADYNHYPLSDQAYELLNNMDHSAQMVKIAGKAFLITGIVSDIMELMPTIEADLHDADKKLGSATDHAVAKMEGRWAGSILGGSIGAKYGALIGTAIFPGPGTAIGGFAGGLILGVAGSYGGDWFAQKVIDITEVIQ